MHNIRASTAFGKISLAAHIRKFCVIRKCTLDTYIPEVHYFSLCVHLFGAFAQPMNAYMSRNINLLYKLHRRCRPGALPGRRNKVEDVKLVAREILGRHHSDLDDSTSSSSSDSSPSSSFSDSPPEPLPPSKKPHPHVRKTRSPDDNTISSSFSDSSPEPHSKKRHPPARKPHPPSRRQRKRRNETENDDSSDEEVKSKNKSTWRVKHVTGSSSKHSKAQNRIKKVSPSKRPRISKQTKQLKGTPKTEISAHTKELTLSDKMLAEESNTSTTATETSPSATVSSSPPLGHRRSLRLVQRSRAKASDNTKDSDNSTLFTAGGSVFIRETNSKTVATTQSRIAQRSKRKEGVKDELDELSSSSDENSSLFEPSGCSETDNSDSISEYQF